MGKAAEAFRTISEVADDLEVPKHVLRFWEVKFPQIRPMKRGGGRRYYRPEDLELLRGIRHLLHAEGYTIKGVQKILREQGIDHVKEFGKGDGASSAAAAPAEAEAPRTGRRKSRDAPTPAATVAIPAVRPSPTVAISAVRGTRLATLTAMLAELETCRALLTAASSPAHSGAASHSAVPDTIASPARRRGAARS